MTVQEAIDAHKVKTGTNFMLIWFYEGKMYSAIFRWHLWSGTMYLKRWKPSNKMPGSWNSTTITKVFGSTPCKAVTEEEMRGLFDAT